MSFIIIKNDNFKVHNICHDISRLIKDINLPLGSLIRQYRFCCREDNKTIAFYSNKNNEFSFFIDSDIKNAFINFIKFVVNENKLNLKNSYKILLIAEKINFIDEEFYELFKIINWQSYKKGLYYFRLMKTFMPDLTNILFNNKISLKDACYFHQAFINQNYDLILKKINKEFTFSEINEITRNIADFAKKEKKKADEIYKIIEMSDDLLKLTFQLKYPHYAKCINDFNNFLIELNLPKGSEIISDNKFEKEEYFLKIKFTSLENLLKKINLIKNNFEKLFNSGKKDKFLHKNLFENLNKK
ncbi:MAG: hypothetical protein JXB50_13420 [Spirochaetes bacterium]|nr:hypothetical protein [Spirochaetota bacterium]